MRCLLFTQFPSATSLRVLDLTYGQVSTVEPGAFSSMPSLLFLGLCDNKLTRTSLADLIRELPASVTELLVGGNNISSLAERQFSRLENLELLDLGRSNLSKLPECVFCGLKNLSAIFLEKNYFRRVPSRAVQRVDNLQILDISQNPFCAIEANDFAGLNRLQTLDLRGCCSDVTVEHNVTRCLPNLKTVLGNVVRNENGKECTPAATYETSCDKTSSNRGFSAILDNESALTILTIIFTMSSLFLLN